MTNQWPGMADSLRALADDLQTLVTTGDNDTDLSYPLLLGIGQVVGALHQHALFLDGLLAIDDVQADRVVSAAPADAVLDQLAERTAELDAARKQLADREVVITPYVSRIDPLLREALAELGETLEKLDRLGRAKPELQEVVELPEPAEFIRAVERIADEEPDSLSAATLYDDEPDPREPDDDPLDARDVVRDAAADRKAEDVTGARLADHDEDLDLDGLDDDQSPDDILRDEIEQLADLDPVAALATRNELAKKKRQVTPEGRARMIENGQRTQALRRERAAIANADPADLINCVVCGEKRLPGDQHTCRKGQTLQSVPPAPAPADVRPAESGEYCQHREVIDRIEQLCWRPPNHDGRHTWERDSKLETTARPPIEPNPLSKRGGLTDEQLAEADRMLAASMARPR